MMTLKTQRLLAQLVHDGKFQSVNIEYDQDELRHLHPEYAATACLELNDEPLALAQLVSAVGEHYPLATVTGRYARADQALADVTVQSRDRETVQHFIDFHDPDQPVRSLLVDGA